jgi:hypothetical protein
MRNLEQKIGQPGRLIGHAVTCSTPNQSSGFAVVHPDNDDICGVQNAHGDSFTWANTVSMVNEHMHGFYDTPKLEVAIHVSARMAGAFLYGTAGWCYQRPFLAIAPVELAR